MITLDKNADWMQQTKIAGYCCSLLVISKMILQSVFVVFGIVATSEPPSSEILIQGFKYREARFLILHHVRKVMSF